ncbi:MFS transporter [Falsiroseomonas sp.]|uniref:MFS transporter n=1 Tax=Falsiroseomonas sp. TaxID=2870721 RepID=UPI003568B03F
MPLLALAYLAFIGLGLPDPLPGTLWPEVAPDYGLPNAALGLVLAGLAVGYIAAGLLAGRLIQALGIGGVLAASLAATALAAGGQALAPPWAVFVVLALLAGLGGGAVDAALNGYSASHFAPRHLNWLHACWGIGATLGPALAAGLLAAGAGWQAGYGAVALLLAPLALACLLTRRRWDGGAPPATTRVSALSALRVPAVRLQMGVFFVYTGLEAGAGQWAATVLAARGASPAEGAAAATLFWAGLAAARIGLGFVVDRIGPDRLLRLAAPVAVLAAAAFALGLADRLALVLLAAALAPVYPTLMARTPARLGAPVAVHAIGFQVAAAMAGVAALPGAMGLAADLVAPAAVPWMVLALALLLAWLIGRLPPGRT